jgi:23S rRNA (pseudouridine1915-N3)-methyltransferase
MKVKVLFIGKTEQEYLKQGISEYENRIKRYVPFEIVEIPPIKNMAKMNPDQVKRVESEKISGYFSISDLVVLLDEKGKEMSSVEFAEFLRQKFLSSSKNLVFAAGGAYGFNDLIKKNVNFILSLSRMTFSHQMVRLFFLEQLYRALTIIKKESYHHG